MNPRGWPRFVSDWSIVGTRGHSSGFLLLVTAPMGDTGHGEGGLAVRRITFAAVVAGIAVASAASPAVAGSGRSISEIVLATNAKLAAEKSGASHAAHPAGHAKSVVIVTGNGTTTLAVVRGTSRLDRSSVRGGRSHRGFAGRHDRSVSRSSRFDRLGRGYSRYNRVLRNDRGFSSGFSSGFRAGSRLGRSDQFSSSRFASDRFGSHRSSRFGRSGSSFNRGFHAGARSRIAIHRHRVGRH